MLTLTRSEEEDEETAEWENEQLRRGGHTVETQVDPNAKPIYRAAPSTFDNLSKSF
jgi:GC-rich sequence DNA-binding factor